MCTQIGEKCENRVDNRESVGIARYFLSPQSTRPIAIGIQVHIPIAMGRVIMDCLFASPGPKGDRGVQGSQGPGWNIITRSATASSSSAVTFYGMPSSFSVALISIPDNNINYTPSFIGIKVSNGVAGIVIGESGWTALWAWSISGSTWSWSNGHSNFNISNPVYVMLCYS